MRISDWSSDVCSSDLPALEGPARDAQLLQRALGRQVRLLDDPNDLQLLGCGLPHSSSALSAIMLFLSNRFSSASLATHSLRARPWRRSSCTSPVVAARAVSPATRRLPASMNSFDHVHYTLRATHPLHPP